MIDTKPGFALRDAIDKLDWFNLQVVLAAAEHRRTELPKPDISAAQRRAMFPNNATVMLVNLRDHSLNGQLATVRSAHAALVEVDIAGRASRVAAECLIPVPPGTAAIAPAAVPIASGDAVITTSGGKYGGKSGLIVATGKRLTVLLTDTLTELKATAGAVERTTKPSPQPTLRVSFKNEEASRDPFGRITVIDTTQLTDALPHARVDLDSPAVKKTGWIRRSSALAYARSLGAQFEES